ncbi:MAG: hypothetical protein VX878_05430, partial [Pseudomonadota bacterium]|nr:hypothetical protein [Pseudomonadota bacterium]
GAQKASEAAGLSIQFSDGTVEVGAARLADAPPPPAAQAAEPAKPAPVAKPQAKAAPKKTPKTPPEQGSLF